MRCERSGHRDALAPRFVGTTSQPHETTSGLVEHVELLREAEARERLAHGIGVE
jgi:hypothetical protein